MAKIKLTIQNGHRNVTNGQTGTSGIYNGKRINEVDLVDSVYYAMKAIIDSKYTQSIQLSYDDATVVNGVTADYFMALHFDGATNPVYDGGFVDCDPDSATVTEDWKFATKIADYYFNAMGIRFAPEHRTANSTYYYAFNSTGANTKQMIIELGTMTNSDDMSKIQDYNKIAQLLMNGLVAYLGLKEDITVPPIVTPPTTDPCQTLKTQITDLTKQLSDTKQALNALQVKTAAILSEADIKCQGDKKAIQDKCDITIANYKTKPKLTTKGLLVLILDKLGL